jgi:hypothetical protein
MEGSNSIKASGITKTVVSDSIFKKALSKNDLKFAYELALQANSKEKWEKLAKKGMAKSQFDLSQNCLRHLAGTDILFLKSYIICPQIALIFDMCNAYQK